MVFLLTDIVIAEAGTTALTAHPSSYKPWRLTWDPHQHQETPKLRITYLLCNSLFRLKPRTFI